MLKFANRLLGFSDRCQGLLREFVKMQGGALSNLSDENALV